MRRACGRLPQSVRFCNALPCLSRVAAADAIFAVSGASACKIAA